MDDKQHPSLKRTCFCKPLPIPRTTPTNHKILERFKDLVLETSQLQEYMKILLDNIKRGLAKKTHEGSAVKCFVTYVQDIPDGSEEGKFLALDLGGTNFRVLLVELQRNHFQMKSKIYATPSEIMLGPGSELFDFIAECLSNFVREVKVQDELLPLGFTFSFPLRQDGLTRGILTQWSKGFNCDGVVGNDVVQLLEEAIARRGDVKIDVCAVLNDTTGTLMSCAWKNRFCKIGIILGTGTNACYVEKRENAEFMDEPDRGSGKVLINTEWGSFGNDGSLQFLRTKFDQEVDVHTVNRGRHINEKMISGLYLGELVRLLLEDCIKDKLLLGGKGSPELSTRDRFYSKYVSDIEADPPGGFTKCRDILQELGITHATDEDCTNIRYICEVASRRAAHLASAGVATILNKINEPRVTVGIDGSLYRHHPHFHHLMMEKINELVNPGTVFDLMLSEDGSGRGAALVAAVASKKKHGSFK